MEFYKEDCHMKTFRELIKQYRNDHKLTQVDFAKLINKTQVTVSNYKKSVHFPSVAEELDTIAKLLNKLISYIICNRYKLIYNH